MSPFTCVPAYTLPVYASQWPLPDTTQDSVHGCWLGFAAVAITGDRIPCAYKAQPSRILAECERPFTAFPPDTGNPPLAKPALAQLDGAPGTKQEAPDDNHLHAFC